MPPGDGFQPMWLKQAAPVDARQAHINAAALLFLTSRARSFEVFGWFDTRLRPGRGRGETSTIARYIVLFLIQSSPLGRRARFDATSTLNSSKQPHVATERDVELAL